MLNSSALQVIVAEGMTRPVPELVERDGELPHVANRAVAIVGPRRCGKTYRMYQRMRELAEEGVERERMLLVDFEDDRMFPRDEHLVAALADEHAAQLAAHGVPPQARRYLFLDEVQNAPEWGRQVRRLIEREGCEVCLSGSSAKMLSKEIATEFRGRSIGHEMLPLSFVEFARFNGIEARPLEHPGAMRTTLLALFRTYLESGGFPEAQGLDSQLRVQMLQELADVAIARDICARHNLPVTGVEEFVKLALRGSGREFSANKCYNTLRSLHIPLSRDTAFALPGMCEDAYLFFTVPRFTRSYRAQRQGARKLYAVDPGVQFAVSPAASLDLGQRFEDAVYLHLRRRRRGMREGGISVYRASDGREVDFVIGDAASGQAHRLVQACVEITDDRTAEREYGALTRALDETGLEHGDVVVLDSGRCIPPQDERIRLTSAWSWFLE